MLYEMLTGKKPFDADNHMAILVHHAKAPIPRLPDRLISIQPLIDTLMAKDAGDRPADADTAAKLIEVRARWSGHAGNCDVSTRRESRGRGALRTCDRPRDPACTDAARLGEGGADDLPTLLRGSCQLREEGGVDCAGIDLRLSRGSRR